VSERREEETMLPLRYLLILAGLVLFGSTGALVAYDVYLSAQLRRLLYGSRANQAPAPTLARRPKPPSKFVLRTSEMERGIRR
jgi:hypothetical protein